MLVSRLLSDHVSQDKVKLLLTVSADTLAMVEPNPREVFTKVAKSIKRNKGFKESNSRGVLAFPFDKRDKYMEVKALFLDSLRGNGKQRLESRSYRSEGKRFWTSQLRQLVCCFFFSSSPNPKN